MGGQHPGYQTSSTEFYAYSYLCILKISSNTNCLYDTVDNVFFYEMVRSSEESEESGGIGSGTLFQCLGDVFYRT